MDYQIMSGDIVTAEWIAGKLHILDEKHLPLFLKNFSDLHAWLESRAIDDIVRIPELLKKALRLTERDDVSTVLAVHAATITDRYWIRTIGSPLTYADIRFDSDYFSNLALHGSYDSFNRAASGMQHQNSGIDEHRQLRKVLEIKRREMVALQDRIVGRTVF